MQDDSKTYEQIMSNNEKEKESFKKQIAKCEQELKKIVEDIKVMKSHIPDAMTGSYPLSVEIISDTIKMFEDNQKEKESELKNLNLQYENMQVRSDDLNDVYKMIPTWTGVFNNADKQTKRVLINKIVEKIIITNEKITIKFKVNLDSFTNNDDESRNTIHNSTTSYTAIRGCKSIIFDDINIDMSKV